MIAINSKIIPQVLFFLHFQHSSKVFEEFLSFWFCYEGLYCTYNTITIQVVMYVHTWFSDATAVQKIHLPPLLLPIHSPPTLSLPSLNYLTCLLSTRRNLEFWVWWPRPGIGLFEGRRSLLMIWWSLMLIWRKIVLIEEAAIELEHFVVAWGEIV